jgi:hypothetical protein
MALTQTIQEENQKYQKLLSIIDIIDCDLRQKEEKLRQEQAQVHRLAQEQQQQLINRCNKTLDQQNQLHNLQKINQINCSLLNQRATKEHSHYAYHYMPSTVSYYSLESLQQMVSVEYCQHEAYIQKALEKEQKDHKELMHRIEKIDQENQKTIKPILSQPVISVPKEIKKQINTNEDILEKNECPLCNTEKSDAQHRCEDYRCDKKICIECRDLWKAKEHNTCPYCFSNFQK